MAHIFRTPSGDPRPTQTALAHAAMGAELTAIGDDIASPQRLEHLVQQATLNHQLDFKALNNRVLRAIVDCLSRGDDISKEAVEPLSQLCRFTHDRYAPGRSFVFANLKHSLSPGLHPLQRVLEWAEKDPQATASQSVRSLRFSMFAPEQLGDEHVLIEDSLARAAVFSLLQGEHCHGAATTFAKLAVSFRTAPGDVLPRKAPSGERQNEYAANASRILESVSWLVYDARRITETAGVTSDFGRLGTSMQRSLQCIYDSCSTRTPWAPLGYFLRSDMLLDLGALPELKFPGASAAVSEMQQEIGEIWGFLDSPAVSSVADFHQVILVLEAGGIILPSTKKAVMEFKSDLGIYDGWEL